MLKPVAKSMISNENVKLGQRNNKNMSLIMERKKQNIDDHVIGFYSGSINQTSLNNSFNQTPRILKIDTRRVIKSQLRLNQQSEEQQVSYQYKPLNCKTQPTGQPLNSSVRYQQKIQSNTKKQSDHVNQTKTSKVQKIQKAIQNKPADQKNNDKTQPSMLKSHKSPLKSPHKSHPKSPKSSKKKKQGKGKSPVKELQNKGQGKNDSTISIEKAFSFQIEQNEKDKFKSSPLSPDNWMIIIGLIILSFILVQNSVEQVSDFVVRPIRHLINTFSKK